MKFYIRTYGCQMNERDSDNIVAEFIERGWEQTFDESQADIAIVNTCSVREQAEQKAIGKLWHLSTHRSAGAKKLPVVGVTGCMAQNRGENLLKEVKNLDFVAGARKTHIVADLAIDIYNKREEKSIIAPTKEDVEIMAVREKKFLSRADFKKITAAAYVDISDDKTSHLYINKHPPRSKSASVSSFISIMQGCQMNCSYCIVPKVRGVQRSRPIDDIIAEAKMLVESGTKEVNLLGQVVNAFGREFSDGSKTSQFVRLLQRLNDIDGLERIRFTSPHPSFFKDDLIDSYGSLEKLCEYVHLPLQSGSDNILKQMRRPYTSTQFLKIVDRLRSRVDKMSISTDIIVGYPDETDEDFNATRKIFKASNFDMAFIFKYSPREGTLSATQADSISEEVKEDRNQLLLSDLAEQSMDFNNALINSTQQILVEGSAKRGDGMLMGKTRTHRKVIFKGDEKLIGKLVDVKITSATVTALDATLLEA